MNISYISIFYNLKDTNKINYLKEININFNKIKNLTIHNCDDNIIQKNINNFFNILFSFNNIENNLIYLNIEFKHCEINPIIFENLNNFKSLRYLLLKNINFDKEFIIKLKVLKVLSIISCKNIYLSEITNENLKKLYFYCCEISDINILKKVNCNLNDNNISDNNLLGKIKFKELKILDLMSNNISDINVLAKVNFTKLNELSLSFNEISDINRY